MTNDSNLTALGLDLEWEEEAPFTLSPLNALVIAECFDSDGDTTHIIVATPGMKNVKAAGLIKFAETWAELRMINDMVRASIDYSEEE